ncbi:MAG: efflux RND transporter periplasmic adaptor subunit [Parachlamydiaceae bacterium]|nr:efflux RND transporter periplasmic adaptor subunit [Parachlamydiaceae bacterium]
MSRSFKGISFIILSLLTSCADNKTSHEASAFVRPLPVTAAEVTERDIPVYIEAIGNVAASNSVNIKPRVGGIIDTVYIQGGDNVKAGDPLYKIDRLPYEIALEKAQANLIKNEAELEFSKTKLDRYQGLIQQEYVSHLNIEEYKRDVKLHESQVIIDKAEIENAKINLDYCDVCSPINGKVSLTKVDQGNLVQANDFNSLISILQVTPVYVYFSLAQKDFQELQELLKEGNRKFKVLLPFDNKKEFEGELNAFDNQVDSNTGTIQLKGTVANEDEILWPGEFVKVKLFVKLKEKHPVVPLSAIQTSQKGSFVYVLKPDMTVDCVPVTLGEHLDDYIAIDAGLTAGMKVITDGQLNLRPGAKVTLTDQAPAENPSKATEDTSKKKPEPEKVA